MTYHGHVKNGVIVLDEPGKLPDGTRVVVHRARERRSKHPPGSPAAILEWLNSGIRWHGEPGEMERLYQEMQAEKWAHLGGPPKSDLDS